MPVDAERNALRMLALGFDWVLGCFWCCFSWSPVLKVESLHCARRVCTGCRTKDGHRVACGFSGLRIAFLEHLNCFSFELLALNGIALGRIRKDRSIVAFAQEQPPVEDRTCPSE